VTQFYNRRETRLSDAPSFSDELFFEAPSSPSIEDVSSPPFVAPSSPVDLSPKQLIKYSHRLHRPPDYSSPTFTTTALSEPTSYCDVIIHPEWQHAMVEEIVALERTST
jgi:hypothetical protein